METLVLALAVISLCIIDLAVLGISIPIIYKNLFGSAHDCISLLNKSTHNDNNESNPVPLDRSVDEQKKIRDAYIKQEQAFQELMNYNAYKAYGMEPNNEE